jgi:hypothetical protein
MTSKCANPSCDSPFRYFRGGRLFLFESVRSGPAGEELREGRHRSEYFWRCELCARTMTIASGGGGHAVLASRTHVRIDSAQTGS